MSEINDLRVTLSDIERELTEGKKKKSSIGVMGDLRKGFTGAVKKKPKTNVMGGEQDDWYIEMMWIDTTEEDEKSVRKVLKKQGFKQTSQSQYFTLYRKGSDKKGVAVRLVSFGRQSDPKTPSAIKIFINQKS